MPAHAGLGTQFIAWMRRLARRPMIGRDAAEAALALPARRPLDSIAPTMAWIEQATLSSSPLISVVLATRNRAEKLGGAIESVRAQTYRRFELVVADDASADETAALLASIGDERVRSVSVANREGGGPGAARNAALADVRGELIAYLDDDNRMHPGWLRSVVWAFEQRPATDVLYGALVIDDVARPASPVAGTLPSVYLNPYGREAIAAANPADTSAIAHRAGLAEAWFDPQLTLMGDWDLLARLTTDADPLVLPAIAAYCATGAPHRVSGGPTAAIDAEIIRRRARAARGLVRPAEPPAGAGALLRSLHDPAHPLELGGWALSAPALERLLALVPAGDRLVVECGSGESTIAIARLLRARGRGRLQALEHYPAWASEHPPPARGRGPRRSGRGHRRAANARPGAPNRAASGTRRAALERLGEPIDLLLVDGPPSGEPGRERSRYPALPALEARLAPGAAVVLDDAGRPGERWVLERWEAELRHPVRAAQRGARDGPGRRHRDRHTARALNRRPEPSL